MEDYRSEVLKNLRSLRGIKTGEHAFGDDIKVIDVLFDIFRVKVVLNDKNEFVGIEEIKIDKSFIKASDIGYFDVDEYYKD